MWVFLLVVAGAAQAADEVSVVRVATTDRAVIGQIAAEHGHVIVAREKGVVIFEADAREIERLRVSGLAVEVDADATAKLHEAATFFQRGKAGIPGYACYRTVTETNARLAELQTLHPGFVSVIDIGDSWEKTASLGGDDLRVIKVTNAAIAGPKPAMFMMTAIHAREYATAEVGLRFVEWLLANYGTNADATWILDTQEIHLLVQSNPDGRKQAETGILWRKNANRGYCGTTSQNRGADLNRNWPFKWNGAQDGNGSSGSPCQETYRGPAAASEPETTATHNYVTSLFPDQRGPLDTDVAPDTVQGLFLDIHSYSQLVLWPWGWTNTGAAGRAPNGATLETLARRLAWFNGYEPEQSNELYSTDGTTDDTTYGELGVPAFTIELGTAFFEGCASFESTTNPLNFAALLYGARIVRAPYRWPSGPEVRAVAASPDLVVAGEPVTLTAIADDSRFNQQNGGAQATHAIASASAYIGTAPWSAGASAQSMSAADGAFNAGTEALTATVSTAGLSSGKRLVYVQARDANGADGAPSAAFVDVATPAEIATVHGAVRNAVTAAPIAGATITVGAGATQSATGTGAYSRRVRGGTYTIGATATDFEPYAEGGVVLGGGSDVTRDIAMYPLCALIDENAENGLNGWTTQVLAGGTAWGVSNPNAVTTTRAFTDSPSGSYTNGVNTALQSPLLDLTGYTSPVLSFDSYCDTESGYDFGRVEVSTTPGTWTEVFRCDAQPSWRRVTLELANLAGASQARVRFRFQSDSSQIDDGWYVDNITLKAGGPTCRNAVLAAPGAPDLAAASDSGLSNGDDVTNATTLSFAGTCTNGDAIRLRANGGDVSSPVVCAGSAYALSFAPAEGTFAITTRATRGSIESPDSTAVTVVVDRTAPSAPSVSMPAPSYPTMVTIGGTMTENVGRVTVREGATPLCESAVFGPSSGNAWSCVATLSVGSHAVSATHMDTAGNVSAASATATLDVTESEFGNGFE